MRECEGMCFLSSKLIQNLFHQSSRNEPKEEWQKWECRDKEVDALVMFTWTPILRVLDEYRNNNALCKQLSRKIKKAKHQVI